jgi:xanthine dehydrogenase YagS FAD-binding subunit
MMPDFSYVQAANLEEAIRLLSAPGSCLHAGGTDLLGCLRDGVFSAGKVVSISGLTGLRGIKAVPGGGLRIGALATLTEIAAHPGIQKDYPALAQAAASAASPQLRNQGTLGGNLCQRPRCWYFRGDFHCARKGGDLCYAAEGENEYHCIFGGEICFIVHPSDTAPALVALEAAFRISGPKGQRSVPAGKFFVLPGQDHTRENVLQAGEILTEVILPAPLPGGRGGYFKARSRATWDFALAGVASSLQLEGDTVKRARLVLSGVAPAPWHAAAAEQELVGHKLDADAIARAAAASVKDASPLGNNGYKVTLLRGTVEEALSHLA